MFGNETEFATDFTRKNVAEKLEEAGFSTENAGEKVEVTPGENVPTAESVRENLHLNPAKVKPRNGSKIDVYV